VTVGWRDEFLAEIAATKYGSRLVICRLLET
jgi:hypothetical protein